MAWALWLEALTVKYRQDLGRRGYMQTQEDGMYVVRYAGPVAAGRRYVLR